MNPSSYPARRISDNLATPRLLHILLARALISLAHKPSAHAHQDTTMHDHEDSANLRPSYHRRPPNFVSV